MIRLSIAEGRSADATVWKNRIYQWPDFLDKLYDVQVTRELYSEFKGMSKPEQGRIKDIGGYVCGFVRGGRRKKENIISRTALTLDIDYAPYDFINTVMMFYGDIAFAMHSTHSHCKETPRYRLIIPLDREVTPDESQAIHRRVAQDLGIEYFDPTTFDVNRLMFWPSVSKDGEYFFETNGDDNAPALCADKVLARYRDWRDISQWKFHAKLNTERVLSANCKQQDPLQKSNIVGQFCNAYSIHEAIEEFLSNIYEYVDDTRYTYIDGSTTGGLVIYDDKFAYSHHGSDPASGQLCNAFDLVRIHKYGSLDKADKTTQSYKAMCDYARTLEPVKKKITDSIIKDFDEYASYRKPDFVDQPTKKEVPEVATASSQGQSIDDWMSKLEIDRYGRFESSAHNVNLIVRNDPAICGRLRLNSFDGKKYTTEAFPWVIDARKYPRALCDADMSGFRNYLGRKYRIKTAQDIDDAVSLELNRNTWHPVKDYLRGLKWDGVERIDTLLCKCFNAADNVYTREVSRKTLIAAVARVMNPGCKFDTVTTLIGPEGTRKSSFWQVLAGDDWFSDSLVDINNKDAYQQLQGKWITELAEMSAMAKADVERVKQYVSSRIDSFRPSHGREVVDRPRQGIFVATSNNRQFLRGSEGNRRFWPIDVNIRRNNHGEIDPLSPEFKKLRDQIWAEAYEMYFFGEPLILSQEAQRIANKEQADHTESDDRKGVVEEYLDMEVPDNWDNMPITLRQDYISDPTIYLKGGKKTYIRDKISALEIWCECFGKNRVDADRRKLGEIHAIMRSLPGWKYGNTTRTKYYGKQVIYEWVGD